VSNQEKITLLLRTLHQVYPDPHTALVYANPFELLVATILSAQTTDVTVNAVTPALFEAYPTPQAMTLASEADITRLIAKVNFNKTKAKNIKAAAETIVSKHSGQVPDNMVSLLALPGVARKTANVVLGNAFHKAEGVVVDTHVMRLSIKLGLTDKKDPVKIEQDLMRLIPRDEWIDFPHLLILFGREYCPARPHECASCPLADVGLCPDAISK
jgi:endonuclease III